MARIQSVCLIGAALVLLLNGCQSADMTTTEVRKEAAPKAVPVRNETDFTNALVCMDLMLKSARVAQVSPLVLAADKIPDRTGKVNAGAFQMLIGAISTMSTNSRAIEFIPYDRNQILVLYQKQATKNLKPPLFFLRGAVTQVDQAVSREQIGGSVDVKNDATVSASADSSVDMITLDMSAEYVRSLQVVPGVTARNSIRVGQKGAAIEPGGFIGKAGLLFNFNFSKQEGSHQALRALIELGAIEIIGQMTNLPYWHCLRMTRMDPEFVSRADLKFGPMSEKDKITYVAQQLKSYGGFKGPVTGVMTPVLANAVAVFERQYGQLPDGRVDQDLLRRLYMLENTATGWWNPAAFRKRFLHSIVVQEKRQHLKHLKLLQDQAAAEIRAQTESGENNEVVQEPSTETNNAIELSSADRFQKVASSTITAPRLVRNAQDALIEKGHRTRAVDGRLDADMVTEIRRFEEAVGLPLNGELNEVLYRHLVGSVSAVDSKPAAKEISKPRGRGRFR